MQAQLISELESVHIPVIDFPWKGGCAPGVDQLEERMQAWALQHGLIPTPAHQARMERAKYATLAARCHPHAEPALLQALADFFTWLFIVDDHYLDHVDPFSADTLPHLTSVLDVLDLDPTGLEPVFGELAWRDLCQRLRKLLPPENFSRFAHGMRMWASSAGLQLIGQLRNKPLSPRTYCAIRRHVGAMNPCMAIIDAANAGPLSPEEYRHPELEQLRLHANHLIVWCNDLQGIHVEVREPGERRNFILVYMDQGHSLQESLDYTAQRVREEIQVFEQLATRLEARGSRELKGFISGLRIWMRGYQDWVDHDTQRYSARFAELGADTPALLGTAR
ncbi:terpene synthase family protein [Myxococcus fulvus]|uniref:terpene synthase family protein n=1 Tax=Myxococcus fulvus TaxID=33 RepID=UPI003B9A6904